MSERFLIVGLGNPDREHEKNRHNVGFQILDFLAARHGLSFSRKQSNAAIATGTIASQSVVLAKPQIYMNRSGSPVKSLLKFYKVTPEHVLIVFDDMDLPIGTIRIKPEGGSSGQNGMKDVINHLGTREFPRMRIGIDRPPGKMDPVAYVLQDFRSDQMMIVEELYARACDGIESWLRDGITLAMSRHNAPASVD
jgi:PTH1 family peptidyl-tRNA hydrolase